MSDELPPEIDNRLERELEACILERDELQRSIQDLSHPNIRMLLAERDKLIGLLSAAIQSLGEVSDERDAALAALKILRDIVDELDCNNPEIAASDAILNPAGETE